MSAIANRKSLPLRLIITRSTATFSLQNKANKSIWRPPTSFPTSRVLYEAPHSRAPLLSKFAAASQMVCWGLWSHLVFTQMRADDGIALAPPFERTVAASGLLFAGGTIVYMIHRFMRHRITRVVMLPGGRTIQLHTASILGNRSFEVPITNLRTWDRTSDLSLPVAFKGRRNSAVTDEEIIKDVKDRSALARLLNTDSLVLKLKGQRAGFMLDKDGEFPDPNLWDYFFYKPLSQTKN